MAVVSLKDLHKSYPLGKESVEAVKGVSFDIEKGEFAAISGPSGSGKSTILNMVGLIDLPSAGSIIIGGTDVYEGVNLSDAEIENNRWASSGNDKKKKKRTVLPAKLDKRITGLRRSHIGFIFQTFNLIPVLNVYENIEFPLLLESKDKNSKSPVDSFTKAQKEEWIDYLIFKHIEVVSYNILHSSIDIIFVCRTNIVIKVEGFNQRIYNIFPDIRIFRSI